MPEIGTLDIKINTQEVKDGVAALDKLTDAGKRTEQATKQVETATDRLQRSMLNLRGVVAGVVSAFAAYKAAEYVKDAAMLSARYETLGVTMAKAGANAGYTRAEMDHFEASLRSQGIAAVEARQTLTKLAAANMDLSKASAMARASQDLAVVAGINSSEAFERLVTGIQTGQTETLRTLGINVNFEKSYKDLAKQLKVNVDQLTEQEKIQARMNATMDAATGYAGLYEGAMDTAGKQITSLKRYTDDLAVSFGTAFNEPTAQIVKDITKSVKELDTTVRDPAFQLGVNGIGQFGAGVFGALTTGGTAAIQVLGNTAARITGIFIMVDAFMNRHQEDLKTGYGILTSADPAKALKLAGTQARDRALTYGPTPTGQVLAPGSLEAEFNIQQAGRTKGPVKREQTQAQIDKARTATASLVAELAKANDASDEGTGKVAELQKKYDEYAKTLGRANPLVQQYGALIAYANEHNGHTPAEVAKVNRAIEEQIDELNKEIYAIQSVSDMYGAAATDQLAITKARIAAEKEYSDAVRDGGDEAVAAERKLLKLVSAQAQIDEAKKRSAQSTAIGFAGPALDAQESDLRAHYALVAKSADDRLAVERELQSKLNQLRSTALKKTENPYDGLKAGLLDYTESVGTASSRMAEMMGKGFKGAEDALSQMVGKGKGDLASLFDLMRVEAARSMFVQPLLGGFASALKGFNFASLFNADGNAFGPGGVYAFASGGIVSSPTAFRFGAGGANLGIMGEAGPEAIMPLKRGSDGKLGVAAPSGGPQNVTVKLVNQSGQQIKASTSKVTQDSQGTLVTVILDAVNRNVGGIRTGLQAALGN